jgi:single-strand DNA-binding protein
MAWDMNRVVLIGRLTKDVELKYTPNSTPVANFSIAVGGKSNQDGTESVSFFNIVVWGKSAESCAQYLSKGKQCAIDGRLDQKRWEAQDGSKRSTVEIIAERVEFLWTKNDSETQGGGGYPEKPPAGGYQKTRGNTGKTYANNRGATSAYHDNSSFDSNPLDDVSPF